MGWNIAVILLALATQTSSETGVLKGHISIGPVTPVQRVGQVETVPPSWYAPYQVSVARFVLRRPEQGMRSNAMVRAAQAEVDLHGDFTMKLQPGDYNISVVRKDGKPNGFRRLPTKTVTINRGKTTKVVLTIDTGIR